MSNVWKSQASGLWYVSFAGGNKSFSTQIGAEIMAKKLDFATNYSTQVKSLLSTLGQLTTLKAEFIALNYGATMTDADVAPLGILVADLIAASVAVDALNTTVNTGTNAKMLWTVGS